jgi:hypothetical protein
MQKRFARVNCEAITTEGSNILTPARSEGKYYKLDAVSVFRFLRALRQHAGSKDFFFYATRILN